MNLSSSVSFLPDSTSTPHLYYPTMIPMQLNPPQMLQFVSAQQPGQLIGSIFNGQFVPITPMHQIGFINSSYLQPSFHDSPENNRPIESKEDPTAVFLPGTQNTLQCSSISAEPPASTGVPQLTSIERKEDESPAELVSPTMSSPSAYQSQNSSFEIHQNQMIFSGLFPGQQTTNDYSSVGPVMVSVPQQLVHQNVSTQAFSPGLGTLPFGTVVVNMFPSAQPYLAPQVFPAIPSPPVQNLSSALSYLPQDTPPSANYSYGNVLVQQGMSQPREAHEAAAISSSMTDESHPTYDSVFCPKFYNEAEKKALEKNFLERYLACQHPQEWLLPLPHQANTLPTRFLSFRTHTNLYTSYDADHPYCLLSYFLLLDAQYLPNFYPDWDARMPLLRDYLKIYRTPAFMRTEIIKRLMKDGTVRFPLYNVFGYHKHCKEQTYDLMPPVGLGDGRFYYTVATLRVFQNPNLSLYERQERLEHFVKQMRAAAIFFSQRKRGDPSDFSGKKYLKNFIPTPFLCCVGKSNGEYTTHVEWLSPFKIIFHLLRLMFLELTDDPKLRSIHHAETDQDHEAFWNAILKEQLTAHRSLTDENSRVPRLPVQEMQRRDFRNNHQQGQQNEENPALPTPVHPPAPPVIFPSHSQFIRHNNERLAMRNQWLQRASPMAQSYIAFNS